MMIHRIGVVRDPSDERNAVGEPLEGKRLDECVAATRPAGQGAECPLDLEIGKFLSHRPFYHAQSAQAIAQVMKILRRAAALLLCLAPLVRAQEQEADSVRLAPDYWRKVIAGATTSILLHEMGHIATSLAVGGHPTFGFDKLRPTVYSGIDVHVAPHKQFLFSAAGLSAQSLLDEGILDIPHHRGGAFERGLLGGGIGTTVFYLTIGRRGSVSDVDFMARTHALTVAQVTLLFGGVAAMHSIRVWRDPHYASFFAQPSVAGGVDVGVRIDRL